MQVLLILRAFAIACNLSFNKKHLDHNFKLQNLVTEKINFSTVNAFQIIFNSSLKTKPSLKFPVVWLDN